MNLVQALTLAIAAAGTAVATVTVVKALIEYRQQGILRRADRFFELRRRMKAGRFIELAGLLDLVGAQGGTAEEAADRLASYDFAVKRDYAPELLSQDESPRSHVPVAAYCGDRPSCTLGARLPRRSPWGDAPQAVR